MCKMPEAERSASAVILVLKKIRRDSRHFTCIVFFHTLAASRALICTWTLICTWWCLRHRVLTKHYLPISSGYYQVQALRLAQHARWLKNERTASRPTGRSLLSSLCRPKVWCRFVLLTSEIASPFSRHFADEWGFQRSHLWSGSSRM